MKLTIESDWDLEGADSSWLPQLAKQKFAEACNLVNDCLGELGMPLLPDNAWDHLHVDLILQLHWKNWYNEAGIGVAGQYHPCWDNPYVTLADMFAPKGFDRQDPGLRDRIELSWTREQEDGMALRHEFGHMVCRHALLPNWQGFGHGGYDGQMDPYMAMIQRRINFCYSRVRVEYPVTWRYPSV